MSKSNNKMGVVQLTILTAVNMMGSGIIMLPTKLAEVGTISIVSWLVTAVGSMALAYAFAKCGMFSRKSGGMGGYAEYAFGKSGNFMANYTYGVSLLIANIAIAISAVGYGTEARPVLFAQRLLHLAFGAVIQEGGIRVGAQRTHHQTVLCPQPAAGQRALHHQLVIDVAEGIGAARRLAGGAQAAEHQIDRLLQAAQQLEQRIADRVGQLAVRRQRRTRRRHDGRYLRIALQQLQQLAPHQPGCAD